MDEEKFTRLVQLAKDGAEGMHMVERAFDMDAQRQGREHRSGHQAPFSECPHSDCVLVREAKYVS